MVIFVSLKKPTCMRILIVLIATLFFYQTFTACNSSAGPKTFCDTACLKDTIKFEDMKQPHQPYLYISPKNCKPGDVIMSHSDMAINRKIGFGDLAGDVRLNKDNIAVYFNDSTYAWVTFNDCVTGRGYIIQIPFNKVAKIRRKATAFTSFDPKYDIAPGLVAYTDKGNIFTEDMATGTTAMMTFGEELKLDYDNMHEYIDSVNVTPTRIWARIKVKDKDDYKWIDKEKAVEMKMETKR
jgi:hypothetical protein